MVAVLTMVAVAEAEVATQVLVLNVSDGKLHLDSANGSVYTGQPDAWSWDAEKPMRDLARIPSNG